MKNRTHVRQRRLDRPKTLFHIRQAFVIANDIVQTSIGREQVPAFEHIVDELDLLNAERGNITDGVMFDLPVFALGFAKQEGRWRIPVGYLVYEHGFSIVYKILISIDKKVIYMATFEKKEKMTGRYYMKDLNDNLR